MTNSTPCSPRAFSPSRKSRQLDRLSRLASSTARAAATDGGTVEPQLISYEEKMAADAASRAMSNAACDIAGERATFKAGAVYETLKRRILDGIYPPGDWLRLSQLARDFSLSEMPIREALRLLQKDGLVVLRRYRGAQVVELSMVRAMKS